MKELKPNLGKRLLLSSVGAVLLYLPVQSSFAQLEEIVVTARRYEESINDAPLAVTVMDSGYLRDQQINHIGDVLNLTPGASFGAYTMAQPAFTVRGILANSLGNASLETSMLVVTDGVAMTKSFMMTQSVYDIERVEVMRGPQGTTFGRNATLGIMHFISARPEQERSSAINVQLGTLGLAGVDGYTTGALSDNWSGRLAFKKWQSDGSMESETTGESLEGWDQTSIRGSLLYDAGNNFTAYLKAEHNKDDGLPNMRRGESCTVPWMLSPPYNNEYTANCDPWKGEQSIPPEGGFFVRRDVTILSAELAWNVGDLTITSVSGYQDGDHHTMMDVFGTPQVLQDQEVYNDATVLSTELRIDNSASDSRLHWLAGIYLADDTEDRYEGNYGFPARGNSGGRINPQAESYWITTSTADTSSLGLFGELSFDISERVSLTVGGRYSEDKRDYLFSNVCSGRAGACKSFGQVDPVYGGNPAYDCGQNIVNGLCGTQANPMGIVIPLDVSDSWDDFSAKVSLSYALNDNQNIYALYSEGFKAGGFQHDARNAKALLGVVVQPEKAVNYELGWKGSYDTVRFAVTVFQMEQKNAQATALIPVGSTFTTSVINYGGVEQKGIEVEATWLVAEHLLFGGSLGLYDGKLGPGSVTGAGFDDATGQVTGRDVSGQATGLDNTYVLYGEYDIDLSGGSNIKFRADIQHRSIIPAAANRTGVLTLDGSRETFARPAIDNVGASLTWTSEDGGMAFSLWGKNLLDQYDWKNIGPAIGFHYNNGGSGPGSAARGYSGRKQIGLDGRFRF